MCFRLEQASAELVSFGTCVMLMRLTASAVQATKNELVMRQEKELETLMKKLAASKAALQRSHASRMLQLEQHLKGWFNPR